MKLQQPSSLPAVCIFFIQDQALAVGKHIERDKPAFQLETNRVLVDPDSRRFSVGFFRCRPSSSPMLCPELVGNKKNLTRLHQSTTISLRPALIARVQLHNRAGLGCNKLHYT